MQKEYLPEKVTITCTDNDMQKEAYLDKYDEGKFMEVIVNTVRLRLVWNGKLYIGNMTGLEFTAQEPAKTIIRQGR